MLDETHSNSELDQRVPLLAEKNMSSATGTAHRRHRPKVTNVSVVAPAHVSAELQAAGSVPAASAV